MTRPRRPRPASPRDAVTAPAWQRLLFGAGMVALGIATLLMSLSDLRGWIAGLRGGAPLVETNSGMLAMVPLGLCFLLLSALAPLSYLPAPRRERVMTPLCVSALAFGLVGIVLALVGQILVAGVMAPRYRVCASDMGTRTLFVTWGRRDRPCPATT